jgi:thioredoxin 1
METLEDRNQYVKATMADGLAVLEGTTTWCSQCKAIKPFVEQLMKKYPDARFYNYDTEQVPTK